MKRKWNKTSKGKEKQNNKEKEKNGKGKDYIDLTYVFVS